MVVRIINLITEDINTTHLIYIYIYISLKTFKKYPDLANIVSVQEKYYLSPYLSDDNKP